MKKLFLLLLIITSVTLNAQTVVVDGIYKDKKDNPIADADVRYYKEGLVVDQDTTNADGEFLLQVVLTGNNNALSDHNNTLINYPNPFSGNTIISFSTKSNATLSLYDLKGSLLLGKEIKQPGHYQFEWGGKSNIPGIQLCQLKTKYKSTTIKLISTSPGNQRLQLLSYSPNGDLQNKKSTLIDSDSILFTKANTTTSTIFIVLNGDTTILHIGNPGPDIYNPIIDTSGIEGETLSWYLLDHCYNDELTNDYTVNTEDTWISNDTLYHTVQSVFTNVLVDITDLTDPTLQTQLSFFISPIGGGNQPPVAVDDVDSVDEDDSVIIDVLANDYDPDGSIDLTSVDTTGLLQPAHGIITLIDPANGGITYQPDGNYSGSDIFEYIVYDDGNPPLSDIALVTVTINEVNDAPTAVDDNASTGYETLVVINVPSNDYDIDGNIDPTSVSNSGLQTPSNGSISINPTTGEINYTPDNGFSGDDWFEYKISDDGSPILWDTAVVNVSVAIPGNSPPVAVDDTDVGDEDQDLTIDVLANDTDPDGNLDPTSVDTTGLLQPIHGQISYINPSTGHITYVPDANYFGTDQFEYRVYDTDGLSDVALVTTTTLSINDNPTANDDNANTNEDTQVLIDVAANDTDIDGNVVPSTVSTTGLLQPTHGNTSVNGSGEITYTPDPDWSGTDTFEYEIWDDGTPSLSDIAIVTVNVNAVNDAPYEVTPILTQTINEDGSLVYTVRPSNVDDIDSPSLGYTLDNVVNANYSVNGDQITVTPTPDWYGTISNIIVNATDGEHVTSLTGFDLIVNSVNDNPVAVNDSDNTNEDTDVTINVIANDYDIDGTIDPTTVSNSGLQAPSHGSISINGTTGAITYTPDANWFGTDSFEYKVYDNEGAVSNVATVSVIVASVNDAPVALDDAANTDYETAVVVPVLNNDYDIDGNLLPSTVTNSGLQAPAHGSISINSTTGAITYTPDNGYSGGDSFEYKVYDDGTPSLYDIATVSITVGAAPNQPPDAVDDVANVDEDNNVTIDVLANDTDPDNNLDPTSVETTGLLQPSNGSITNINGSTGHMTYEPDDDWYGIDTFEYKVFDTEGLYDIATVTVTVNSVNDAPVAVNDNANTAFETPVTINVLVNDSDIDGNLVPSSVTNSGLQPPAHGSISINSTTGEITYTPDNGYSGNDSFGYKVSDDGTPILWDDAMVNVVIAASTSTPVTFYFKDAALDTDITGETCTLYYRHSSWTQDSTLSSTNGQVTINMEVGDTYEIDGSHTGDLETSMGLTYSYTALERPGDIEAFEQRAVNDQSSPMTVQAGESTVDLYKMDATYPIGFLQIYASYLGGSQEGTRKFSTSDAAAKFWVDLSNGGQSLNTDQTEWYNDIKSDLASVPHVYVTLPLEQSATTPSDPHNRISINASNPPTPTNYTTFNTDHEIQVGGSLFPLTFSEYYFKIEFYQALGDLNDIGGNDPQIINGSSQNYTLNTTGRNIFAVMYLFKPGTEF